MIYETFKSNLIGEFEKERDMLVIKERRREPESLFGIRDENDRLYMRILTAFEMIVIHNVEKLVVDLCKKWGLYYSYHTNERSFFDMEIEIGGEKKYIEFRNRTNTFNSSSYYAFAHKVQEADKPVLMVFLIMDSIESRESIVKIQNRMAGVGCEKFNCVLFEDFVEDLCGIDEKLSFQNAMVNFKSEMHKIIGYQITELCSSYNLMKMKEQLEEEIKSFDYNKIKEKRFEEWQQRWPSVSDIREETFNTIKSTFLEGGRYKVLLGNVDFAESFITSEWLYKKYFAFDELDNTFIVAGFLKSIEQLLWRIIFMLGQGRHLRGVVISDSTEEEIDKTLGALQYFLSDRDNADLFQNVFTTSRQFVINYLKRQISDWRKQYRNGYFHKHNLKEKECIEEIREETYFLYLLILGSINLSSDEIDRIS